jgi:hypothetical protein
MGGRPVLRSGASMAALAAAVVEIGLICLKALLLPRQAFRYTKKATGRFCLPAANDGRGYSPKLSR